MSGYAWNQDFPATTPTAKTDSQTAILVYDPVRNRMVMWSGDPSADRLKTWEYYSGNWHQVNTAAAPAGGGFSVGACYDTVRNEVVLVMQRSSILTDTWTYNGTNWTLKSPATSPVGTVTEKLVFDTVNGVAVLVGGASGPVIKVWTWNGTTWADISPVPRPANRASFALGYYPPDDVTILFGGSAGFTDTWELSVTNGTWTQLTPATTPTLTLPKMTWMPPVSRMVMFGGGTAGNMTWLWDGTDWTNAAPSPDIPVRTNAIIGYDGEVSKTMEFGGRTVPANITLYETWFLEGPAAVRSFVPQIYRRL